MTNHDYTAWTAEQCPDSGYPVLIYLNQDEGIMWAEPEPHDDVEVDEATRKWRDDFGVCYVTSAAEANIFLRKFNIYCSTTCCFWEDEAGEIHGN